jgi:dolichyl-phosphate beta-glucosyltransferase
MGMDDLEPPLTHSEDTSEIELSVIIPAFNESCRLPPTLERITCYLDTHGDWQPAEIVVVDDGSIDGTAAAAAAVEVPPGIVVKVERHPRNLGKGAAVRTGFGLASGHWVLLTDADLSAPIEELSVLARGASRDCVAIGSRAVARRLVETPQPRHRDFMGRTFNLLLRTLHLTEITDTQCGFKLFPGDLARALANAQRLDGFAFDVELLLLAHHWGFAAKEIGVRWSHIEASRVMAVRHSLEMFGEMLRLWWWKARGDLQARPEELR